jgi:hypothetical protein
VSELAAKDACPATRSRGLSLLALCGVLLSAGGCGTGLVAKSSAGAAISGQLRGGQQPVSAATIQLYSVGTTGDGSVSTPLLTQTVTSSDGTGAQNSNANAGNKMNTLPAGGFDITGDYTCPAGSQVYIVALGGNPGLAPGTNNSALAMMAALGPCPLSTSQFISVNEVTTVGSIAPVAGYMTSYKALGSDFPIDGSIFDGLLAMVPEYVDTSTGSAPGPALPTGYYASTTELQTLADIVAGCVNSTGGVAGDTSVCGQLFTLATPSGGVAATDTIGAIINILKNPTRNVIGIYGLLAASAPFQPALSAPPTDWSLPVRVQLGAATQLAFGSQPADGPAGPLVSVVNVQINDANGHLVTSSNAPVTLAFGANPGGGKLGGTTTVNAVNGVATFPNLSVTKPGTGYTLVASSPGLTAITSTPFSISVGTAVQLVFGVQPSNTNANAVMSPAVTVLIEDTYGNLVNNATDRISVQLTNSSTLGGTTTVSAVNGVATFSNITVPAISGGVATVTGNQLSAIDLKMNSFVQSAFSTYFDVTPDPTIVTQIVFGVQPSNVNANAIITPAVTVLIENAYGQPITTASGAVSIRSISTLLNGTLTVNAVNGVATFSSISVPTTGTNLLLYATYAPTPGLNSQLSNPFNVTPDPTLVAQIAFGVQPTDTYITMHPITPPVTVLLQNAYGQTVPTANGAITISAIAASPYGTLTVNAVNGVATFSNIIIPGYANNIRLVAAYDPDPTVPIVFSNPFTLTPPPAQIVFGVQPSNAQQGQPISPPFTVLVEDSFGNTVPGYSGPITVEPYNFPLNALTGTLTVNAVNGVATFSNVIVTNPGTGLQLSALDTVGGHSVASPPFNVR